MKAAVFDLDGTLFDTSERLRRCLEEAGHPEANSPRDLPREARRKFWDCFLSDKYMHLDRIDEDVASRIRELASQGIEIIIITGRREDRQMIATLQQLERNDIPWRRIIFRRPGDYRKDAEFKKDAVMRLLAMGYDIVEVWDDSPDVIRALRELLPRARLVLYSL